jgi:hypothetical protein
MITGVDAVDGVVNDVVVAELSPLAFTASSSKLYDVAFASPVNTIGLEVEVEVHVVPPLVE